MKKLIFINVLTLLALSATCQKFEAGGNKPQGSPVIAKPAAVVTKAYSGGTAQVVNTPQPKPVEMRYEQAPVTENLAPAKMNNHAEIIAQPDNNQVKTVSVNPSEKQVKEPLPAALKGTSLDPNAKPVIIAAKTPTVNVPAKNSGNTQADAAIATPAENSKAVEAKPATQAAVRPLFNQQPTTGANAELSQPMEAKAATTTQAPEAKIDASRAVPMEEVKPSAEKVTQPKVPAVSKQGSGN